MFKDTFKDIHDELTFMPITLLANKLKVLIVGGGNAALIKAKAFLSKGALVEVIALEFIEEFYILNNILLKKSQYIRDFILDKHIIVIAIDNTRVASEIIKHCEELSKIYINSTNFKEGIGIIPVSRESENITISVNTKLGNPKASIMIAEEMLKALKPMDKFIGFTSIIRNRLDIDKNVKREILEFINTMDFKYFYDKGKYGDIINLFYGDDIANKIEDLKK